MSFNDTFINTGTFLNMAPPSGRIKNNTLAGSDACCKSDLRNTEIIGLKVFLNFINFHQDCLIIPPKKIWK